MKRLLFFLAIIILMAVPSCVCSSFPGLLSTSSLTLSPTPSSGILAGSLSFDGEISRGQMFETGIGRNLTFRLVYYAGDGEGWYIWVGDKTQPDHDFSANVTPPYRGINSRYIEGWHFRNAENTGLRSPDDHSVPQGLRGFYFVLNEADYQIADEALRKMMWPYNYSEKVVEQAWEMHRQLEKAEGILTIKAIELGNLIPGERAWINHMEFEVEIHIPSD